MSEPLNPVMTVDLIDHKAKRAYPATYTQQGKTVKISFGYNVFKILGQDIKGLEGSAWSPDDKCWKFTHPRYSRRNANVLGYLTNGKFPGSAKDAFTRYLQPLKTIKPTRPLMAHQQELLNLLYTYRRYHCAHDMGLGKTLTLIEWVEKLKDEIIISSDDIWVIAPKAPIKAWQYELIKWDAKFWPKLITCDQSAIKRAMDEAINPPQILVLDESSRFKNKSAQRTQLVLELARLMNEAYYDDYFIANATGTSAPRDPTDWHSQIEILCPGFIKEKDANQLKQRLADLELVQGPHGSYNQVKGFFPKEVDAFYQRLKPIVNVKFKKDCLDLPPKIYQLIECPLLDDALKAARLIVETSTSVLEATQKLRQLSDGFQYPNGTELINRAKVNALIDELDSLRAEDKTRVVIYSYYTASIDIITKTCLDNGWNVIRVDGRGWKGLGIEGKEILAEQMQFQDLDLNVPIAFVGQVGAGGMGLTLTASDTTIFYSNGNRAEDRQQAEDRIYRIGTKGAIIKDIIHLPTDEKILESLKRKQDLQSISLGELAKVLAKGYKENEAI